MCCGSGIEQEFHRMHAHSSKKISSRRVAAENHLPVQNRQKNSERKATCEG